VAVAVAVARKSPPLEAFFCPHVFGFQLH